jgi:hypothetical protein
MQKPAAAQVPSCPSPMDVRLYGWDICVAKLSAPSRTARGEVDMESFVIGPAMHAHVKRTQNAQWDREIRSLVEDDDGRRNNSQ